jgi:uncharacterized protein
MQPRRRRRRRDTLGKDHVLAFTAVSAFLPERETKEAKDLAAALGAQCIVIRKDILANATVAANPPDRCYYCKAELFAQFISLAQDHGYQILLDGANADDVGDWRPGQRAARELGVRSPLMELGITKDDIRQLSRKLGLPTWKKPSYACLASRVPYGTMLTPEILTAIEAAEAFLYDLGFRQMRVRHHGDLARIEVGAEEISRLLDADLRQRLVSRLREIGYQYVTLDLQGYRTGSMNEVL